MPSGYQLTGATSAGRCAASRLKLQALRQPWPVAASAASADEPVSVTTVSALPSSTDPEFDTYLNDLAGELHIDPVALRQAMQDAANQAAATADAATNPTPDASPTATSTPPTSLFLVPGPDMDES